MLLSVRGYATRPCVNHGEEEQHRKILESEAHHTDVFCVKSTAAVKRQATVGDVNGKD